MAHAEPLGNKLLDRLPGQDRARLLERAERVTVPLHEVAGEPGEAAPYAHFPLTCVYSSIVLMRDGSAIEAATIGNEGVVPLGLLADERTHVYRTIVQVEGESLRVPSGHFRSVFAASEPLRRLMERYALTITHQSGQSAACNARHTVENRMCRWLLMTQDRVRSDKFFLTHEDLASMLGVRRQSVSEVAKPLQDAGLIRYVRGNITILDRAGLERAACECYEAIWEAYDRIIGRAPV